MAYNSYSDNLFKLLGPKGDLADFRHASRLFVENNFALAPKFKFLYHVFFSLDPSVGDLIPSLTQKYTTEIGLLVKSAALPKYSAQIETKNMYNRKKNVQTNITYEPIDITFHDDNLGITTALLEAYYRFYYADAWHENQPGAYNKAGDGDKTYKGTARNQFRFGLDNNITVPFFKNIQLTQLSRNQYTTFTLVNPIITNWSHDTVDSMDNATGTENSITVAYEAVHYSRGTIETGDNGNPVGFGSAHYDVQPSPLEVNASISGSGSTQPQFLYNRDNTKPQTEGFNLKSNTKNPSYSIQSQTSDFQIGGLSDLDIPLNNGQNGNLQTTSTTAYSSFSEVSSTVLFKNDLENNPSKLDSLAKKEFSKSFLENGGDGGINGITAAWSALPESEKQIYKNNILDKAL